MNPETEAIDIPGDDAINAFARPNWERKQAEKEAAGKGTAEPYKPTGIVPAQNFFYRAKGERTAVHHRQRSVWRITQKTARNRPLCAVRSRITQSGSTRRRNGCSITASGKACIHANRTAPGRRHSSYPLGQEHASLFVCFHLGYRDDNSES